MDNKKKVVKCNECWREFEIEDNEEWGYCLFARMTKLKYQIVIWKKIGGSSYEKKIAK